MNLPVIYARQRRHELHTAPLFWLVCCILVSFFTAADALNIAIVSSGSPTELLSINHIIGAARQRSHSVVVLVNAEVESICENLLGHGVCLSLFCSHSISHQNSSFLRAIALLELQKGSFLPSVVLASALFAESAALSMHYGVPLVLLAGSRTERGADRFYPIGRAKYDTKQFTWVFSSVLSSIREFYEDFKVSAGLSSDVDFYATHHIITQGIPGLDFVEGSCPNFHHVGFLRADSGSPAANFTNILPDWQQSCKNKFIYANIGTTNNLLTSDIKILVEKLADATSYCVLWYSAQQFTSKSYSRVTSRDSRVAITYSLLASPSYVLHQYKPLIVLSDSIGDVLHDAIFIESPIVYLGTNQAECEQVLSAGVGLCADRSSLAEVISTTMTLQKSTAERESIRVVRRMGFLMGGAQKALDVIELAAQLGVGNTDFFCDSALLASPYGYNGSVLLLFSFAVSLLVCIFFSASCYLTCRQKALLQRV
ncbi:hypothetical protein ABL78_5768 [Leptomonas seymouri]|uniref:Uncharacterized protein n=1 Tax=Leptomonas seymouri TaxID=5684 RepID=A0A0N1PB88_LEPSE|nr:hypothetical protein ABL78_5768 [Leptomonas seymouri]|eukprot:KPI85180.1 hypothetical protein ABL78_5768 [Leptomonas seymouri]